MKLNQAIMKMALGLVAVLVLVLAWFLVITPARADIASLEAEIAGLKTEKTRLEGLQAQVPQFEAEIAEYEREINETLKSYPKELPQERTILFVDRVEKDIPIRLYSMGFGGLTPNLVTGEIPEESGGEEEGEEEEEAEPQPVITQTSLGDTLLATETVLAFSYKAGYAQFKQFLNFILTYEERLVMNDISLAYDEGDMMLAGSFNMYMYAIDGPGRPPVVVDEPPFELGAANIFMPTAGLFDPWDTDAYISPDFFLMISSQGPAWTMGRSRDVSEDSYLILAENSQQDIVINFTGMAGTYEVKYSIGDEVYDGSPVILEKEDSLNIDIYSFANTGRRQNVLANLRVNNETDLPVNITIYDDDTDNPRIKSINTYGFVRVRNNNNQ
ncbi:MAG: hypothetical protein LBI54_03355 [Lachnospiraceae bacterium]|jgi:cell division protein FtsB|nr:hypothetical protein [Lachnospiraceae bacterium]